MKQKTTYRISYFFRIDKYILPLLLSIGHSTNGYFSCKIIITRAHERVSFSQARFILKYLARAYCVNDCFAVKECPEEKTVSFQWFLSAHPFSADDPEIAQRVAASHIAKTLASILTSKKYQNVN